MNVEARVDNIHAPIKVYRPVLGLATLTEDLVIVTTVSERRVNTTSPLRLYLIKRQKEAGSNGLRSSFIVQTLCEGTFQI